MASANIKIDIEPLVYLTCFQVDCIYNRAMRTGDAVCNLKNISIREDGKCAEMILRDQSQKAEANVAE